MHTYRNPWFKPGTAEGTSDPEFYRTNAKPKQLGKYEVFHRIKDRKPPRNCFDYVLDGVVVTQRCGGGLTEAELDADARVQKVIRRVLARVRPKARARHRASDG